MSHFGNVSADVLAGAVEKLVAKMDESELAGILRPGLAAMPSEAFDAFVEATLDAFRDRGESSEDVAEGAGTTLTALAAREPAALAAFVDYTHANSGVLREGVTLYAQEHPELVDALPPALRTAIAQRLAHARL